MISEVENKKLRVFRKFPKIIKLYDEYFDYLDQPDHFIDELKNKNVDADIFTFVQKGVSDEKPKYNFYHEFDQIAVLHLSTYEEWFNKQIKHEERNRILRAQKHHVEVRQVELNDELVKGIKNIYDEDPLRQGRHFWHYNKSLEEIKSDNETFGDRSRFIGAYYEGELIGFIKFMIDGDVAYLMQAISLIAHRDKSPMNALLAKTVELCAKEGLHYVRYGNWSRRGLGHFKESHGFKKVEVPRYYIPLKARGKLAMCFKMHRDLRDLVPEKVLDLALELRSMCKDKFFHAHEGHHSN